jgi:hypothetical protein
MKDKSLEELLDDLSFYSDVSDEHYKIQAEILLQFENLKCCGNCYYGSPMSSGCNKQRHGKYCSLWQTDGLSREEREGK